MLNLKGNFSNKELHKFKKFLTESMQSHVKIKQTLSKICRPCLKTSVSQKFVSTGTSTDMSPFTMLHALKSKAGSGSTSTKKETGKKSTDSTTKTAQKRPATSGDSSKKKPQGENIISFLYL